MDMKSLAPFPAQGESWWNEFIPEDALSVPLNECLRTIWKDQAIYLWDGALRDLARAKLLLELQMGRRIARIRDLNKLMRLGYRNVSDLGREELKIGTRTIQEITRVAVKLEMLPVLRAGAEAGHLNQSQLRMLTRFVTPETEGEWFTRAVAKPAVASAKAGADGAGP